MERDTKKKWKWRKEVYERMKGVIIIEKDKKKER
jgi:hypothetical protein